jgi:hypothetical protein
VRYKETTYQSLSAAALAASRDLGLTAKTLDGWAWWGLKTRQAPTGSRAVTDLLTRAFAAYHERAAGLLKSASAEDADKLRQVLRAQSAALSELGAE